MTGELRVSAEEISYLEQRLGRRYAKQRLGVERDHEAQVFGQGLNFFHIENLRLGALLIESVLKMTGLYWLGKKNAARVIVRQNWVRSVRLPERFSGFTILQLSDLHADMSEGAMKSVAELLGTLTYDLCVLTGDYRGKTSGPFERTLAIIADLTRLIQSPMYGVLGNHDSVLMVSSLENLGIRVLLNESETIEREGQRLHLAGIDDAHFYRSDNIEKAGAGIPHDEFSILLSHTPEIYRQAAHADFNLMLSGHTHGGQICLPGGAPIKLNSVLPRHLGSGSWRHHGMHGYTSVGAGTSMVPVRLNCAPEITLHRLEAEP